MLHSKYTMIYMPKVQYLDQSHTKCKINNEVQRGIFSQLNVIIELNIKWAPVWILLWVILAFTHDGGVKRYHCCDESLFITHLFKYVVHCYCCMSWHWKIKNFSNLSLAHLKNEMSSSSPQDWKFSMRDGHKKHWKSGDHYSENSFCILKLRIQ